MLLACQRTLYVDYGVPDIPEPPQVPSLEAMPIHDLQRQRIPEQVDILWVVDNSTSMLAEQQLLSDNFPFFLQYYRNSGLDWQIAVVSTDMANPDESGKLQGAAGFRWVDSTVPDPVGVFTQMALLGRDGSAREQGRAAAYAALSEPLLSGYNGGFYRDEALLSIIMVSDENDFSEEPTEAGFVAWARALKNDPSKVTVSGIVGTDTSCTDRVGQDYLDVISQLNGITFSICENDWEPLMQQLGVAAIGLQREFFLTEVPVESTLEVWIEDEGVRYDFIPEEDYFWDGDRNSVNFVRYTPRPTAWIHMVYDLAKTK
jgi:hypothetical protein